jgi:hypothetical protein
MLPYKTGSEIVEEIGLHVLLSHKPASEQDMQPLRPQDLCFMHETLR